jgi:hypothetical protein
MSIQFKPEKEVELSYDDYAKILRNAVKKGIDQGGKTIQGMITTLDFELAEQGEP